MALFVRSFVGRDWIRAQSCRRIGRVSKPALRKALELDLSINFAILSRFEYGNPAIECVIPTPLDVGEYFKISWDFGNSRFDSQLEFIKLSYRDIYNYKYQIETTKKGNIAFLKNPPEFMISEVPDDKAKFVINLADLNGLSKPL